MTSRLRRICLLFFLALALAATPATTSGIDFGLEKATAELDRLSEARVRELLAGATALSQSLLAEGRATGKLYLIEAGSQLALLVSTASATLGNALETQVGAASQEAEPVLAEIVRFAGVIEGLDADIAALGDDLSLDIAGLASRLPGGGDAQLKVQRVAGSTIVEGSAAHTISIWGPDFGADGDSYTTSFVVRLNGVAIPPEHLSRRPPHRLDIDVPMAALADAFKPDAGTEIPLEIEARRSEAAGWWIFRGPAERVLRHESQIRLLPRKAGRVEVVTTRASYEWLQLAAEVRVVAIDGPDSVSFAVPTVTAAGGVPAAGQMRIGAVSQDCAPSTVTYKRLADGQLVSPSDPLLAKGIVFTFGPVTLANPKAKQIEAWRKIIRSAYGAAASELGAVDADGKFRITGDELLRALPDEMAPGKGCDEIVVRVDRRDADSVATVMFSGVPSSPAVYTVTFVPETLVAAGTEAVPVETVDVYADRLVEIDVADIPEQSTILRLVSVEGAARELVLGTGEPSFRFLGSQSLGAVRRYHYKFIYPEAGL